MQEILSNNLSSIEELKKYVKNCTNEYKKENMNYNFGKYLIIQLKIFDNAQNKIKFNMSVNESFHLLSRCIKYTFQPICFINHGGSTSGGHYTNYVKGKQSWYEVSDSRVNKINFPTSVSSSVIILLEKISEE